jgi:nicotinamidase-related amidase
MPRLQRADSLLVIIDVQEKLMPVISGAEAVVQNLERLVRGFHVLDIPIVVTEQYTKGLGSTVPELRDVLKATVGYAPVEKSCFSAYGCGEFLSALRLARRKQIIVAGVETHVCVYQTVKDLTEAGYEVSLIADAVSSRTPENRDIAIRRMVSDGSKLSSTEMALFELVGNSGTDEFRAVSKLIR